MIELHNLTVNQLAICQQLWSMNTTKQRDDYINGLSRADMKTAITLVELIILASTDNVINVDLAAKVLAKYR